MIDIKTENKRDGAMRNNLDNAIERNALYSEEAEQAVLGSVLINAEAYFDALVILKAKDFYIIKHQWIWEVFDFIAGQTPGKVPQIDILTVSRNLQERNQLSEIGGAEYLAQILNSVPTSIHIEAYAKIVKADAMRRRMVEKASEIAKLAYNQELDTKAMEARAQALISGDVSADTKKSLKPYAEYAKDAYEIIEKRVENGTGIVGIPTGLVDLDNLLGGLEDVTVVAGRPGSGKTSFMATVARNAAVKLQSSNKRVYMAILEMSAQQLAMRYIAMRAEVDSDKLRRGLLKSEELPRVVSAIDDAGAWPVIIDDTADLTISGLISRVTLAQMIYGPIGLVVLDYLQLMSADPMPNGKMPGNRTLELTQITRGLVLFNKLTGIPVLAGAQLNRAVEQRGKKAEMENGKIRKYQLADLRDSGSIEQDASIVMFIDRDPEIPNLANLQIEKNRHGRTDVLNLVFHPKRQEFDNAAAVNLSNY